MYLSVYLYVRECMRVYFYMAGHRIYFHIMRAEKLLHAHTHTLIHSLTLNNGFHFTTFSCRSVRISV